MISIDLGNDKTLVLTPIKINSQSIFSIDSSLEKLKHLLTQLESNCVAECCGIDAFNFTTTHLKEIKPHLNLEDIKLNIQVVEAELNQINAEIFISDRLNYSLHRKDFFKLLNHVKMQLGI